jgi:hypothetical protein
MTTFPVRRLGTAGIVPDVFPADLENPSAFTGGVNVRFKNGQVSRAPVFRAITELSHDPGHLLAVPPSSSGYEEVISVAADFSSMLRLNGPTLEPLTPPAHTGIAGNQAITSGFLGGVTYLNRETHAPLCKRPSDDTFVPLPNWPTDDRCRVLRPYKDQLIALGVTKQGTFLPTMVRWSDFAFYGDVPASWDPADTTKSAGENIINEMTHTLVDGLSLRDSFVLYTTSSVWLMDFVGGNDIYVFRKLFSDRGIINPNCAVQVGGMHYVFDRNDIYAHDGITERSICDERTKRFIFGSLDFAKAHLCWVQHDPRLSEVRFSYVADDAFTGFRNATTGCNRQAVYNYSTDTWTFYDAPNIVGGTRAALIAGASWEDDQDISWQQNGSVWMSSEGDEERHTLVVGRADAALGITAPRVYGQDLINGGRLFLPAHPETLKPAIVERTGLDLDFMGKRLRQHMNISAIWPQIAMDNPSDCFWDFGGSNNIGAAPTWSGPFTFDPTTEDKIDVRDSGKYLSYRFTCGGEGDFQLSGFDVQLVIRGRR